MIKHKAKVGFIGRMQKTAKTECGKTAPITAIAVNADCTCPGCIAVIDDSWAGVVALVKYATEKGTVTPEMVASLEADKPRRYQTVWFL